MMDYLIMENDENNNDLRYIPPICTAHIGIKNFESLESNVSFASDKEYLIYNPLSSLSGLS